MIKRLIKHGNSRAIVIDKALLEAAGISENSLFQISVNPHGGLLIQSLDNDQKDIFDENFKMLNKRHSKLMQRLADL
jgi:antitoxin component of MazEF toxin-antitoxin module